MKLLTFQDIGSRLSVFHLEINDVDILLTPFEPFDFLLAEECSKSDSIADKLLWLEHLARRIEAQQVRKLEGQ